MRGVRTHISYPKINTAWTTALKKNPDTLGSYPSRPRILVNRAQLFRAFSKFPTTSGQSLSPSSMTRPSYLNEVTVSNGLT